MKLQIVFIFLVSCLVNQINGDCVIRSSCDDFYPSAGLPSKVPCIYNGPPQLINDTDRLSQLEKLCPFLDPVNNPVLCCDERQIDMILTQLAIPQGLLSRCPSCFYNFANIFCQFSCSPRQSEFVKITETEKSKQYPEKLQAVSLNYAIEEKVVETLFNSCVNVLAPGPGTRPISIMCGEYGDQCTPHALLKYVGQKDPGPVQMNFEYFPGSNETEIKPIPLSIFKCSESPGVFNSSACSCADCPSVCPPLPPLDTGHPFTIFGIDGVAVLMSLLFIASTVTVVAFFTYDRRKKATEDQQPLTSSVSLPSESFFANLGLKVEKFLENVFTQWAYFVTRFPYLIIAVGIILVVVTGYQIKNIRVTVDPVELWSSPKSEARREKQIYEENFGPFYRTNMLIIKRITTETNFNYTDEKGRTFIFNPIFDKDFLLEMLTVQDEITSLTANYENETVKLTDICYTPLDNGKCVIQSPLGWFQNNATRLNDLSEGGTYYDHLISCLSNSYALDDNLDPFHYPCLSDYGGPAMPKVSLGGFSIEEAEKSAASAYAKADTLVMTIVVNNHIDKQKNKKAEAWEQVFLDYMKNFNTSRFSKIDYAYYSERSIEDEINRQSLADISTIVISYLVMFAYVSLTLGQLSTRERLFVDSKVGLGLIGVTIVIASVASSIGVMTMLKFDLTLIIMEVIPFLVLAVGVDNIFILVQHLQRDTDENSKESSRDRVARVIGKCGPSILMAVSCEITCFFLGALSSMPAVRIFALNAGFALLIDFILQMSVFIAFLYLDMERQKASRYDVFCCCQLPKNESQSNNNACISKPGFIHRMFADVYANNIMKDNARIISLIIFILWLCSSGAVINKIDVGVDQDLSMPHDSYVLKYFKFQRNDLRVGPPVYFVISGNYDYGESEHQRVICGRSFCGSNSLFNQITQASKQPKQTYIVDTPTSWLDDYFDWAQDSSCCQEFRNSTKNFCPSILDIDRKKLCKKCQILDDYNNIEPGKFYKYLPDYLSDIPTPECAKAGKASYGSAVKLGENNTVTASYFSSYHSPLLSSSEFIAALKSARYLAENIKQTIQTSLEPGESVEVFPYSIVYVYYEQYLTIYRDSVKNLSLSIIAIFVMSFLLNGCDLRLSLIVVSTIVCILLNLMGLMYWWDVSLNAISLVNLVMACGISVEFCSHIAHAYSLSAQPTRKERAQEALATMGSSVLSGITLTKFAGIIVLARSTSQIFVVFYFRMYLGIVVIGALHGLVLLPILLSIFGGKSKISTPHPESNNHAVLN